MYTLMSNKQYYDAICSGTITNTEGINSECCTQPTWGGGWRAQGGGSGAGGGIGVREPHSSVSESLRLENTSTITTSNPTPSTLRSLELKDRGIIGGGKDLQSHPVRPQHGPPTPTIRVPKWVTEDLQGHPTPTPTRPHRSKMGSQNQKGWKRRPRSPSPPTHRTTSLTHVPVPPRAQAW